MTGFLAPPTDHQVNAVQVWCLREFKWMPTEPQVQEVWANYRGGETQFAPSPHFEGFTSLHVTGLVIAIEKAGLGVA